MTPRPVEQALSWRSVREIVSDEKTSFADAALECLANASDYDGLPAATAYIEAARALSNLALAEVTAKLARETEAATLQLRRSIHFR